MRPLTPGDLSLADCETRWDVTRNTVKNRAKALGVNILRPTPKSAYWPQEEIARGDHLNAWIRAGKELATFPEIQSRRLDETIQRYAIDEDQSAITTVEAAPIVDASTDTSKPTSTEVFVKTHTLPSGQFDINAEINRLAALARTNRAYSSEELAYELGVTTSTVNGWEHGKELRPDFSLQKVKCGQNNYWRVIDSNPQPVSAISQPVTAASNDSPASKGGFFGEGLLSAVIDVRHQDVTGSDLFNSNRIVG